MINRNENVAIDLFCFELIELSYRYNYEIRNLMYWMRAGRPLVASSRMHFDSMNYGRSQRFCDFEQIKSSVAATVVGALCNEMVNVARDRKQYLMEEQRLLMPSCTDTIQKLDHVDRQPPERC